MRLTQFHLDWSREGKIVYLAVATAEGKPANLNRHADVVKVNFVKLSCPTRNSSVTLVPYAVNNRLHLHSVHALFKR